jgi:hypothetical protein
MFTNFLEGWTVRKMRVFLAVVIFAVWDLWDSSVARVTD